MGRHADSQTKAKRKKRERLDENMRLAVKAYQQEQKLPPHLRRGLRKIAEMFDGVTPGTLRNRAAGHRSATEYAEAQQKLTREEEKQLTNLIQLSSDRGLPFTQEEIRQTIDRLLEARLGPGYSAVGVNFVERFINRHHSEIKTYRSTHLDIQRANSLNPTAVTDWFDIVEKEIIRRGITPDRIYGMDESGFPSSDGSTCCVVGRKRKGGQYLRGGANRENVTAIITICADGTYLDPFVIFKGQYMYSKWLENNTSNAK